MASRFFAKPRFILEDDGTLRLVGVPVPAPDEVRAREAPEPLALADRSVLLRWAWQRVLHREETALYDPRSAAWRLTRALIVRFAERVHAAGARLVLVSIDPGVPPIVAELRRLAEEQRADLVDAGHAVREVERLRTVPVRLPDDPHYNAEGHRALALAMAQHLCASGAVPDCS
jgi:hypothetical protein